MKKNTIYIMLIAILTLGGVSIVRAQENGDSGEQNNGGQPVMSAGSISAPVPPQQEQDREGRNRPLPPIRARMEKGLEARDKWENGSTSTTTEGRGQDIRNKLSDFRDRVMGKISEKKDAREEEVRDHVRTKFDVMTVRYQATLGRLQNIYDRTESRIVKIKADGNNTSDAEGYMALAQTDLTNASSSLITLITQAQSVAAGNATTTDASTTPPTINKDVLNAMKVTTQALTKSLNDARNQMMKAVASLMKFKPTATSTPTNI